MVEQPTPEQEVDIQQIMQEIRQQIIARRAATGAGIDPSASIMVTGKRYSPEFYEHLYQAQLALDEHQIAIQVTKSTAPLIGGLIDWIKIKIHELVAYYVIQAVTRQANVSHHLLQALSIAGQEAEEAAADSL